MMPVDVTLIGWQVNFKHDFIVNDTGNALAMTNQINCEKVIVIGDDLSY